MQKSGMKPVKMQIEALIKYEGVKQVDFNYALAQRSAYDPSMLVCPDSLARQLTNGLQQKQSNKSSSPDIPQRGKMSPQVVGLPRPSPLRNCLLRRSLLLTLLQSLLISILTVPISPAVYAKPVSIRYLIAELFITVDMTTVEIAGVADEQHVLIVTKSTLVAGVVIILSVHHEFFLLDRHSLGLADVCFVRRTGELEDGGEGPSAAGANGRCLAPLGDASETKFMQAFKAASVFIVLVEANGTHILICAALFILDVRSLLELLLHRLSRHIHLNWRLLTRLLDGLGQQHPPLLINLGTILLLLRGLHSPLLELPGGRSRHDLAWRVDAGLVERAVGVSLGVLFVAV